MYFPKSEQEIKIIKTLIEYPKREWVIKELSEESGVSKATVWRKLKRLEDKGFLEKEKKGRTIVTKVKNPKLLQNIIKGTQPHIEVMKHAAKQFAEKAKKLEKIKKIILYGSVARETASPESDIDILILISGKDEEIIEEVKLIANKISSQESFKITPTIITESKFKKMKKHGEEFAENIKKEGKEL